jgi:hypothetical protein
MWKKILRRTLLALAAVFVLIQFYPYGREHTNPPGRTEPEWDSPRTRELVAAACFDCHSNQTHWPWYASIAPASWLVQHDVEEGRRHLNFHEFDKRQRHAGESADEVEAGAMPLYYYTWLHPASRLASADRAALIAGLQKTFNEE